MLRGTVYMTIDGVPVRREVFTLPVNTVTEFKAEAERLHRLAGEAVTLEFGPIGEPWGKL